MEGLDLGQTSNPSLAWKKGRFQMNDDDDEDSQCGEHSNANIITTSFIHFKIVQCNEVYYKVSTTQAEEID